MIIRKSIQLLFLLVSLSESHDYHQHQQMHEQNVRNNVKTYGGYVPTNTGHNQAANDFVNSQNHHSPQPSPYQPYGWNFNQPRRTYGGVATHQHANQPQNPQQYPSNHIGWTNFNDYGRINPNPAFPSFPQQNYPFFPFPQFPFPNFFPYANNYPQNYPHGGYPHHGGYANNQGTSERAPNENNNNLQPNQGQLPYPQNAHQPGFPVANIDRNSGGANYLPPTQGQIPQNNVNQGIPSGHINRSPDSNIRPGQGVLPYPSNNQGIPSVDTNKNTGGNTDEVQRPIPQNTDGIIYLPPDQGQSPLPQGLTTETTNIFRTTTAASISTTPEDDDILNAGEGEFQFPIKANTPNTNDVDGSDSINIRYSGSDSDSNKNKNFASNSFFGMNHNRDWTNEDELRWQATTQAPYFENKVPGLECTLPAAAVLGAENAFKTSTLLPLNVPIGKPILSCNASDLLQSNIRLEGKIYGCENGDVTISCPTHGSTVDECHGQILKCDVKTYNVDKVYCTNGTIVGKSDIICDGASILPSQSILNCQFKNSNNRQHATQRPQYSILPVVPLQTSTSSSNINFDNRNEDKNPTNDYESLEEEEEEAQDLMPQVKIAMKDVFPLDLLAKPSTKYLPPQSSMQPIDSNLRNQIQGVFNPDLLASSRNENENNQGRNWQSETVHQSDLFPSRSSGQSDLSSRNWREQAHQNWNFNNIHQGGNDGSKTNTQNRFGGSTQQQHQLQHRLIFTD